MQDSRIREFCSTTETNYLALNSRTVLEGSPRQPLETPSGSTQDLLLRDRILIRRLWYFNIVSDWCYAASVCVALDV